MRVTFLGTGTSHGIPMIGCDCAVCRSTDPHNKRLRPSVFIEEGETCLLLDATPDFRTQALRAGIRRVDAVLVTHTHADHVLGLDDLRAFTERTGNPMPIHGTAGALADIKRVFPYACNEKPAWPSLPSFSLREIGTEVAGVKVLPVELPHGRGSVLGFVFGNEFAYLTDCHEVPAAARAAVRGVTVLVLDGLRHRPHPTHLTIENAAGIGVALGAKLTLLTHMSHDIDHATTEAALPANVRLAFDGMKLEISDGTYRIVD